MNIRALAMAPLVLVLVLAGCGAPTPRPVPTTTPLATPPLRECVLFSGHKICIGNSEQDVWSILGDHYDQGQNAFVERPGEFGTMSFIEVMFSGGKVQHIEEGTVHIDPGY